MLVLYESDLVNKIYRTESKAILKYNSATIGNTVVSLIYFMEIASSFEDIINSGLFDISRVGKFTFALKIEERIIEFKLLDNHFNVIESLSYYNVAFRSKIILLGGVNE